MIQRRKWNRLWSLFLSAALVVTQLGVTANAEGPPSGTGGLCEHHAAHDETCGYVEAAPGQDCEHEHGPECYTDELICGLDEDAEQTATGSDAGHTHTDDCFKLDCPHERGEHGGDCGYSEAVAGTPCGYVCEVCGKPVKDSGKEEPTTSGNNLPTPVEPEPETVAPEGAENVTVTAFDELAEAVKYVPLQTTWDGLGLPATLGASGYTVSADTDSAPEPEAISIAGVSWEVFEKDGSPAAYEENRPTPCVYWLRAVLPEGYTLDGDAALPVIELRYGMALRAASSGTGDFTVTGGTAGVDYDYDPDARVLTVHTDAVLTIANTDPATPTQDKILVDYKAKNVQLTLNGVNIDVSGTDNACAFNIRNAEVELTLAEGSDNILKSGSRHAGLDAPDGSTLVIDGEGALTAQGKSEGAGIGGGFGSGYDSGSITIQGSVTVTAKGSDAGAGIGGGYNGIGGIITITGNATVVATSDTGAGIGGGSGGSGSGGIGGGGTITISGGNVTATGSYSEGFGIGGNGGAVLISGAGTMVTANGGAADVNGDLLSVTDEAMLKMESKGANADTSEYKNCTITDKNGNSTYYDQNGNVFDKNAQIPTITAQPQGGTYSQGASAVLTVNASVTDGGALSYQWYSNITNSNTDGTEIPGATSASYTLPTDTRGTKYYYVVVTNTNDNVLGQKTATVTSETAAVTVNTLTNAEKPTITAHPQGGTYSQNASAVLTVNARVSDGGTLSYQWYSNTRDSSTGGTEIPGATFASYTLPTDTRGTKYYYVVVTNTKDDAPGQKTAIVTSNVAAVTVTLNQTEMPAFQNSTDTLTSAEDKAAAFTLTNAASGTVYHVYTQATGGNPAAGITVQAAGSTLTLTFTTAPAVETTYYISAKAEGKAESNRTTVTVKPYTAPVLSAEKQITAFTILNQDGQTVIDQQAHTIAVTMPAGTDLTSLTPTITVSDKATVSPQSGTAQDFTRPVTYTVTAEDRTTQTYTVTVTIDGGHTWEFTDGEDWRRFDKSQVQSGDTVVLRLDIPPGAVMDILDGLDWSAVTLVLELKNSGVLTILGKIGDLTVNNSGAGKIYLKSDVGSLQIESGKVILSAFTGTPTIGDVTMTGGRLAASSGNTFTITGTFDFRGGTILSTDNYLKLGPGGEFVNNSGGDVKVRINGGEAITVAPGGSVDGQGNYTPPPATGTGDFTVTGGTLGADYTYDGTAHTLTVKNGAALTISGTTTTDKIVAERGANAAITLDGVNIDVSGTANACAFDMTGATVALTLADGSDNILKSGWNGTGLAAPEGSTLTIGGSGKLEVTGGSSRAGIGGGNGGTITINGGTVKATGGGDGAGIGGGGNGGTITINGGTVKATGGPGGAGIGGGSGGGDGGTITINGGTVTATGVGGAGIGGGSGIGGTGGSGGTISINGGTVTATSSDGAGIGGGSGHRSGGDGGIIAIRDNAVVFATSSYGADHIGGGSGNSGKGDSSGVSKTGGVIFEGTTGAVYGNVTLPGDLTIANGSTLTIPDGKTLTNGHTLQNDGTIDGSGTLTGNGTFTKGPSGQYLLKVSRAIDVPTAQTVEQNRVTLNAVHPKGDGEVEYARSDTNTAPTGGWQDAPTFDSLTAGTTYYFFARVTGSAIYMDVTSDGQAITTKSVGPVYSIQATPAALDFGTLKEGYAQPAAQTVTVTNIGSQDLTLSAPTCSGADYELGTLSTTSLSAGGSAIFTVRPKAGLAVGSHSGTLTISGTGNATATVSLSFTVNAKQTGGNGGGGGGSSSGSGSNSGVGILPVNPDKPSANVNADGSVNTDLVVQEVVRQLEEDKAAGRPPRADVQVKNAVFVPPETLQAMRAAAEKLGGTAQLMADSTVNGKIIARVYIETAQAANLQNSILLGVSVDEKDIKATRGLFEKFFANNNLVIFHMAHQGTIGTRVQMAVKVDLAALDKKNLCFYVYDKKTNTYYPIAAPDYFIDNAGYLHFFTDRGGDIIISSGELVKK